jgi:hypothetical protein
MKRRIIRWTHDGTGLMALQYVLLSGLSLLAVAMCAHASVR